jgi:hypothetical protein
MLPRYGFELAGSVSVSHIGNVYSFSYMVVTVLVQRI